MPSRTDLAINALSDQMISTIAEKVSSGMPFKYAALAAGCTERAFHLWSSGGREVEGRLKQAEAEGVNLDLTEREGLLLQFVQSLKKAKSKMIQRNIQLINVAAKDSWQAAAWCLERTVPESFARRDKMDMSHSGKIDGHLSLSVVQIQRMNSKEKLEYANKLRSNMDAIEEDEKEQKALEQKE